MFAIGIHYLFGTVTAAHPANRSQPEWPPHPGRLYMSLVEAFSETGQREIERHALEWLEQLPPPALNVGPRFFTRHSVGVFVPVNDSDRGLERLPEKRPRQCRQFTVAIPHNSCAFMIWPDAKPTDAVLKALSDLCGRVPYLGHSSSLVHLWIEEAPPEPNLRPVDLGGDVFLRVPGKGRLEALQARFEARLRPTHGLWTGYSWVKDSPSEPVVPASLFNRELIVLRKTDGRALGLESTLRVTSLLLSTIVTECERSGLPVPEWVSGRDSQGQPSKMPHLAIVPLASIGHRFADGHLLGLAMVIPKGLEASEIRSVLAPLIGVRPDGRSNQVTLADDGTIRWTVEVDRRESRPIALRPDTWTADRPARQWCTVTPIVLDRHHKGPTPWKAAEDTIAAACERVSLPRPIGVVTSPTSRLEGVPHARQFPYLTRKNQKGSLSHTHATLFFDTEICGPVLLGAGRYRGYGLCRPWHSGR